MGWGSTVALVRDVSAILLALLGGAVRLWSPERGGRWDRASKWVFLALGGVLVPAVIVSNVLTRSAEKLRQNEANQARIEQANQFAVLRERLQPPQFDNLHLAILTAYQYRDAKHEGMNDERRDAYVLAIEMFSFLHGRDMKRWELARPSKAGEFLDALDAFNSDTLSKYYLLHYDQRVEELIARLRVARVRTPDLDEIQSKATNPAEVYAIANHLRRVADAMK